MQDFHLWHAAVRRTAVVVQRAKLNQVLLPHFRPATGRVRPVYRTGPLARKCGCHLGLILRRISRVWCFLLQKDCRRFFFVFVFFLILSCSKSRGPNNRPTWGPNTETDPDFLMEHVPCLIFMNWLIYYEPGGPLKDSPWWITNIEFISIYKLELRDYWYQRQFTHKRPKCGQQQLQCRVSISPRRVAERLTSQINSIIVDIQPDNRSCMHFLKPFAPLLLQRGPSPFFYLCLLLFFLSLGILLHLFSVFVLIQNMN